MFKILIICLSIQALLFAENVDIVYTWVDDSDPDWQRARKSTLERNFYSTTVDANSAVRFRNRDELKYSLRSVFKFAPFFNHIYIVTSGQKPRWLRDHPRITIVPHYLIFKNTSNLPTFNSHAIEANLHRIPGLSDKFIYLNDDVMFGSPVSISDFFTPNGKLCLFFAESLSPDGTIAEKDSGYTAGWKNSNRLLNAQFGNKRRKEFVHGPFACSKSIIKRVEKNFLDVFNGNSMHKFRSTEDYTLTNGLIPYWSYYQGKAIRGKLTHRTVWVQGSEHDVKKNLKTVLDKRPHTFCIEDMEPNRSQKMDKIITKFFKEYFPKKGEFEK